MATPDCDAAPSKLDIFKRGCRNSAAMALFIYTVNDNGTLEKLWWNRAVWTCREHAKELYAGLLMLAREFKRTGERGIKVSAVSLEGGPVVWSGDAEAFGQAVEKEMRRRLSGL